jgi:petrobactin synthase
MMTGTRQVHCLLDCYAEILRMSGSFDWRPLYTGVWNAYFEVTGEGLSYYSESVDELAKWRARFELIYGCDVQQWHCAAEGKEAAFVRLQAWMAAAGRERYAILMVDLYDLPYSNQFRVRHTPHFLTAVRAVGDQWQIRDPYLSWEGILSTAEVRQAFMDDGAVIGIDGAELRPSLTGAIRLLFEEEMKVRENRLLTELAAYIRGAVERCGGYAPSNLLAEVQHAAVIAKRMDGYRYALSYLTDGHRLRTDAFDGMCEEMARGFEGLLFLAARHAMTGQPFDVPAFERKVERMHALDQNIKRELDAAYPIWISAKEGRV